MSNDIISSIMNMASQHDASTLPLSSEKTEHRDAILENLFHENTDNGSSSSSSENIYQDIGDYDYIVANIYRRLREGIEAKDALDYFANVFRVLLREINEVRRTDYEIELKRTKALYELSQGDLAIAQNNLEKEREKYQNLLTYNQIVKEDYVVLKRESQIGRISQNIDARLKESRLLTFDNLPIIGDNDDQRYAHSIDVMDLSGYALQRKQNK